MTRETQKILRIALPLLLPFIGCLYLLFDAQQKLQNYDCHMPLLATQQGFMVATCNGLIEATPAGEILRSSEFPPLHLSPQIYALATSGSDDLLVVDMNGIDGARGINRCDHALSQCTVVLPQEQAELSRPYGIHEIDGQVLVNEPNRDRVRQFDEHWQLVSSLPLSLHEPYGLDVRQGWLVVADTGNQRLVYAQKQGQGGWIQDRIVDFAAMGEGVDFSRPLKVAFGHEGETWVLLADSLDVGRAVVRIDAQGQVLNTYLPPEDAELFDILALPDRLIVSDSALHTLYEVGPNGGMQTLAQGSPLQASLHEVYEEGQQVRGQFKWGLFGACAILIGYLLLRSWQESRQQGGERPQSASPTMVEGIDPHNPEIRWIDPEGESRNQMDRALLLLALLPLLGVVIIGVRFFGEDVDLWEVLTQGPLLLVILGMVVLIGRTWSSQVAKRRLGVLGDVILVHKSDGAVVASQADQVRYAANVLVIGDEVIQTTMPPLSTQQLMTQVYPLLIRAKPMDAGELQKLTFSQQTQGILVVGLLIFLFFIWMTLEQFFL